MTAAVEELTATIDIAAERCVLGAMIQSTEAIEEALSIVDGADFSSPKHRALFEIIRDRYTRGKPVDPIALTTILGEKAGPFSSDKNPQNMLQWMDGAPYIHTLINVVPTVANVSFYAHTVAHKALRRRITQVGTRIIDMARQPEDLLDSDMLIDRIITEAETLRPSAPSDMTSISDSVRTVLALLDEPPTGLNFGFAGLDRLIGPQPGGRLVIVAGRPGQGKTVFACDIARHVAGRLKIKTLYVTLEMPTAEIAMRNISAISRVPYNHLRDRQVSSKELETVKSAAGELESWPLQIWDRPNISMGELVSAVKADSRRDGPPGLIVIDYLQLMQANSRLSNRQEQVAELSRQFKVFARQTDAVVVVLAQLNRLNEQRMDKRPQLSDLRESGSIEQDADVVTMVHRPSYYDKNDRHGEGDILVVKNRHGETGTVVVVSQLHCMRFVDPAMPVVR